MTKAWKPIRRGDTFCSPACGAGCKHADYLLAVRKGEALAKKLGPGWESAVHENMGWFYRARKGDAEVWISGGVASVAFRVPAGVSTYACSAKPKTAVRMAMAHARDMASATINAILEVEAE